VYDIYLPGIYISCSAIFPYEFLIIIIQLLLLFFFLIAMSSSNSSSSKKMLFPISNLEEAVVKNMLNQFVKVKEKSRISYLLILVFIAWFIHKWIFSFSNWFPIALLFFASTQVSTTLSLSSCC
jgi:hypothetical protein